MYFLALFIVGLEEEGHKMMSKFTWGENFYTINKHLIKRYSKCKSSTEVIEGNSPSINYNIVVFLVYFCFVLI